MSSPIQEFNLNVFLGVCVSLPLLLPGVRLQKWRLLAEWHEFFRTREIWMLTLFLRKLKNLGETQGETSPLQETSAISPTWCFSQAWPMVLKGTTDGFPDAANPRYNCKWFLLFLMLLSLGPGCRRQGLIQSHMGKGVVLAVSNSSLNKIFQ